MIPKIRGSATCLRRGTPQAVALLTVTLLIGLATASPAASQIPVVLYGRVQDANSGEPVARARILAGDSTNAVFADSLGNFAIELQSSATYPLHVDHFGYRPTAFELPGFAASEVSLLPLQPAPTAGAVGVEPGDRIRISAYDTSGEFQVVEVRSNGLVLISDSLSGPFEVPTVSLRRLEIGRRKKPRLRGLLGGGFFGGLAGGAFGAQCAQPHRPCPAWSAAPSAVSGAGVGALIGLVLSDGREAAWREVRLPGQLAIAPRGDGGLDAVASTTPNDVGSDRVVKMIVRNQQASPVTVFALWENGARVPLGEVGARSIRSFTAQYHDVGVVLSVAVLSGSRLGARERPESFVAVRPGDRLEWTVRGSGFSLDYIRLPPR